MAQLITMRQRIKAVETIKKITHAMRLISMSTHSRLRHKKVHLETYKNAFQALWSRVKHLMPSTPPQADCSQPDLIILVASQKGLCGTFNSMLFRYFEHEQPLDNQHIIAIGGHAINYFNEHNKVMLASYNNFSASQFVTIAQSVTDLILQSPIEYKQIVAYSNYQKNFFVQRPKKTCISHVIEEQPTGTQEPVDYLLEQSPEELSKTIHQLMLTVTLEELLFDSLLAEQAARFLSMDSSTRNADNLLIEMKLEYNKTRQAGITRELTELATNFR